MYCCLHFLAPRWLFSLFVHTPWWCGTSIVLLSVFVSPSVAIEFICAHPTGGVTLAVYCCLHLKAPRWLFSLFVHTPRWCGTCSVLLSELLSPRWLFSLFVRTLQWCGTCSVFFSIFVNPPVVIQFICAHPRRCDSCSILVSELLGLS